MTENKVAVKRRVLECGDYNFPEQKGKQNSWHVPGGGVMTTREINTWARNYGVSSSTRVAVKEFYYAEPRG